MPKKDEQHTTRIQQATSSSYAAMNDKSLPPNPERGDASDEQSNKQGDDNAENEAEDLNVPATQQTRDVNDQPRNDTKTEQQDVNKQQIGQAATPLADNQTGPGKHMNLTLPTEHAKQVWDAARQKLKIADIPDVDPVQQLADAALVLFDKIKAINNSDCYIAITTMERSVCENKYQANAVCVRRFAQVLGDYFRVFTNEAMSQFAVFLTPIAVDIRAEERTQIWKDWKNVRQLVAAVCEDEGRTVQVLGEENLAALMSEIHSRLEEYRRNAAKLKLAVEGHDNLTQLNDRLQNKIKRLETEAEKTIEIKNDVAKYNIELEGIKQQHKNEIENLREEFKENNELETDCILAKSGLKTTELEAKLDRVQRANQEQAHMIVKLKHDERELRAQLDAKIVVLERMRNSLADTEKVKEELLFENARLTSLHINDEMTIQRISQREDNNLRFQLTDVERKKMAEQKAELTRIQRSHEQLVEKYENLKDTNHELENKEKRFEREIEQLMLKCESCQDEVQDLRLEKMSYLAKIEMLGSDLQKARANTTRAEMQSDEYKRDLAKARLDINTKNRQYGVQMAEHLQLSEQKATAVAQSCMIQQRNANLEREIEEWKRKFEQEIGTGRKALAQLQRESEEKLEQANKDTFAMKQALEVAHERELKVKDEALEQAQNEAQRWQREQEKWTEERKNYLEALKDQGKRIESQGERFEHIMKMVWRLDTDGGRRVFATEMFDEMKQVFADEIAERARQELEVSKMRCFFFYSQRSTFPTCTSDSLKKVTYTPCSVFYRPRRSRGTPIGRSCFVALKTLERFPQRSSCFKTSPNLGGKQIFK